MSWQSWDELVFWNVENGTAVTGTTETILFPNITILARYLHRERILHLTARGKISNIVTTPGTITFRLRAGGVSGTILCQSSAISQNTAAQTDDQWLMLIEIQSRASGTSGSLLAMGAVESANFATRQMEFMGSAGGATGNTPAPVTVDLTADIVLALTAQFSLTGNSITGMMELLRSMN